MMLFNNHSLTYTVTGMKFFLLYPSLSNSDIKFAAWAEEWEVVKQLVFGEE